MGRFNRTVKEDIGLAPDTLVYRGRHSDEKTDTSLIQFNATSLSESEISNISEFQPSKKLVSWLNINGVNDIRLIRKVGEQFNIRSAILSDILNTHSRPRIYQEEDLLFVSIKMLKYNDVIDEVTSENLVLIIKDHLLITFQERRGDVFEPVRNRIRDPKKKIRTEKTEYLAIALLDVIIDNYNFIIGRIGDKIDLIDEQLVMSVNNKHEEQIYSLKSELIYLKRALKPCKEMFLTLLREDSERNQSLTDNIEDLIVNINHASDALDSYRELLSEQLNFVHTKTNNKLNDIMRILTVFSVIFIPLTFIAGIYGTNFNDIPEFSLKYGYFFMLGFMLLIAIVMILLFKKKKWL